MLNKKISLFVVLVTLISYTTLFAEEEYYVGDQAIEQLFGNNE